MNKQESLESAIEICIEAMQKLSQSENLNASELAMIAKRVVEIAKALEK